MTKIIRFRTRTQAAIFSNELQGQISDGMWENARPYDHFKPWCEATAVVAKDGEQVGRNFSPRKTNYDLTNGELLEVIGDRMIGQARLALADFTDEELETLQYRIGLDGKYEAPIGESDYAKRERAAVEKIGLDRINAALADETYKWKDLLRDLREMKEAFRTYTTI